MLRKTLIVSMVIFTIVPLFATWWKITETAPRSRIIKKSTSSIVREIHPLIQKINKENKKASSFSCSEINVKVWQGGIRFRLTGTLYYEKSLNFRMKFNSIFGTEVDIGSNEEIFWYWSRRDKKQNLYFADHEDYHKTRLKTPFNPLFIKGSLGLEEIDEDGYVMETNSSVIVIGEHLNSVGKPILKYTFINKDSQKIEGFLITDRADNPIAIAEIFEYNGNVPKKILYTWYEENKILYLEFVNPKMNVGIDSSQWITPNIQPQINMGDQ